MVPLVLIEKYTLVNPKKTKEKKKSKHNKYELVFGHPRSQDMTHRQNLRVILKLIG